MKAALGVFWVLLAAYGVDQYFNSGRATDPLIEMLHDVGRGFGF